jgi:hypothetical protein
MEIWKDVKGYEGSYQVSNKGNVKSLTRYVKHSRGGTQILKGRILKKRSGKNNKYLSVSLLKNGKNKTFYIHFLVAEAFIGERPENKVIDHIDNNIENNKVENLRYCTQRENIASRSKISSTGYVGVHFNPPNYKKRFRARIRVNNKMKELGSFDTAKEAGQAYINAKNKIENE